jgi:hypothetical protein
MNRALAGFDRTHNFEVWGVFALPFGRDQRWAKSGPASWILGGWLVDPIISKMSGTPFTVTGSGSLLNANGSTQTADLIGNYHKVSGKPLRTGAVCQETDLSCHFFDPSAFGAPLITCSTLPCAAGTTPSHYGDTGRNEFRGPGYFNMNLSVLRNFKITERYSFEVRADAFGFTNTPHFANPNAGCPGSTGTTCLTGSTTAPSTFGTITGTVSPGGFFGPDPGTRTIWFGATLKF